MEREALRPIHRGIGPRDPSGQDWAYYLDAAVAGRVLHHVHPLDGRRIDARLLVHLQHGLGSTLGTGSI